MRRELFALFAAAALLLGMSACANEDNPSSSEQEETVVAPAQLKQGIWTEYDEALLTSGKYTEEQLAQIPTVGMEIKGDKGYFFTYTADDISEAVEGQINYDNKTGKGTITFPAIKDNPLSDQTVSFSMTTDETMEFEFTYEGQKTTGTCAWLCENLDNWSSDITDEDWKELMTYYEQYDEKAGPDASIDWSDSEVEGLDEPLVWNEDALAPAGTRAIGIGTVVSMGLKVLGSLFEEDPNEAINAKLDAVLGKLDQVLTNQQQMMAKVNELNGRLIAIAQKMKQTETVNILNNRNEKFYNPLKVCNTAYFDAAFKLYNDNKSDLSQVKTQLGNYAKTWVGNNEEYITLTWNYIEYLNTVQHSSYGTGMAAIYDGVTFDKYPWEHMGTGDRQNYRANDMFMIAKCLFMINLYAAYGGGSDIKKEGIYNNYNEQKPKLKEFCEFKVSNPNKFLVCQIPGAHFIMHKEIQKYDYRGKDVQIGQSEVFLKEAPNTRYEDDAVYRPKWHVAGSIKIENPKELKEKLIIKEEIQAIYKYFQSAVYPNAKEIYWYNMLIEGNNIAGGAVYSKRPEVSNGTNILLLATKDKRGMGMNSLGNAELTPMITCTIDHDTVNMGMVNNALFREAVWFDYYSQNEYYAAIVEKRF